MADKAHLQTDLKLEQMEKRLSAIYSRAEKEIQKTADEYFARFAKQDEAKRKLVEQGKITEDEYKKWRKGTGYVYVPASLIETYKTATNWSAFANQFRAIEDYPEICGG